MKANLRIAVLVISASLVSVAAISCIRAATPDDDLASAIVLGDLAGVRQALDQGANANAVYQDGSTPLMHACRTFKRYHGEAGADVTVTVKADLKTSKASVDAKVANAHASRSSTMIRGNPEIVHLLIERGSDVTTKNKDGHTALSLAIRNDMPEIAEILRKAGAIE